MMKIYLAGFINGSKIEECMAWRKKIREFYENYKGERYPIDWLDPLNGDNISTIDAKGLKSSLPRNMIVHKDYLSVSNADLIVANMDTFGEQRPPIGTICELSWAFLLKKPIIMITSDENYREHPFLSYFSSCVVDSIDALLEKKIINQFYKCIVSAQY